MKSSDKLAENNKNITENRVKYLKNNKSELD